MPTPRSSPALISLSLVLALAACGGEGDAPEAAAATPTSYMTHRNWGVMSPGREWGRVSGVYIDPNRSDVWVFERCGGDNCIASQDPTVLRFSSAGHLLASFGADMFLRPHGMYVDGDGNVWVTDGRIARGPELEANPDAASKGNQVVKFSPTGEVLLVIGTPGKEGAPPEALTEPNDVIVAPNGEILVSEGHGSDGPGRISRFAADGSYLGSFGGPGSGPGQFAVPHAMALDSQGRLFVADRGNSRIQIFDSSYEFVAEWKQFGRPNDVFIDEDDTMYVVDSESGDERNPGVRRGIYIGSARDGTVHTFVEPHASDRESDGGHGTMGEGVTVDRAGNIYVGEVSLSGMTMFMPQRPMSH
jgi:DNA-binding beta-propeller fold protein YncE